MEPVGTNLHTKVSCDPKFLVEAAKIYDAYRDGTLYEMEWDSEKGELKSKEGLSWIEAKFDHWKMNSIDNDLINQGNLRRIFGDCQENYISDKPIQKSDLRNLDKKTVVKANKVMQALVKIRVPLNNEALKVKSEITDYIQDCKSQYDKIDQNLQRFNKIDPKELNSESRQVFLASRTDKFVASVMYEREIQVALAADPKKSSSSIRELNLLQWPFYEQALKAHEEYSSIWNSDSDLDVARRVMGETFTKLETSSNPREREVAVRLLNIVKYGNEAPEIVAGQKNPSIFWTLNKVADKIKWWVTDLFSSNRLDALLDEKKWDKEDLRKNHPIVYSTANKLVNQRAAMGDQTFIGFYRQVLDLQEKLTDSYSDYFYIGSFVGNSATMYVDIDAKASKIQRDEFFKNENPNSVCFIPYVFPGSYGGLYPQHSVLIILDKKNKQIQYYDPQGLPPDHPDRLSKDINLQKTLEQIREEWEAVDPKNMSGQVEIVVNERIHQEDAINCPYYIADYMKRRKGGENHEEICMNGKTTEEMIKVREQMAVDIIENELNYATDYVATTAYPTTPEDDWEDE